MPDIFICAVMNETFYIATTEKELQKFRFYLKIRIAYVFIIPIILPSPQKNKTKLLFSVVSKFWTFGMYSLSPFYVQRFILLRWKLCLFFPLPFRSGGPKETRENFWKQFHFLVGQWQAYPWWDVCSLWCSRYQIPDHLLHCGQARQSKNQARQWYIYPEADRVDA